MMNALQWHAARDLRLTQVQARQPGPGEVLLQVAYCGICGSDLHEYANGPHSIPQQAPHPLSGCRAPLTLGHEFCGQVVALGQGVDAQLLGQRVAVEPEYRCGQCLYCHGGQYNLCESMGFIGLMGDGGFAEQAVVPSYMLHRLPDSVSFKQAALLEPAAVAYHALNQSSLIAGDSCVVFGLGPIGLLLVLLARLRGVERIYAVDLDPERRRLALELGASQALDGADPHLQVRLRQLSAVGIDSAFEAAGTQQTLSHALNCLRKGGEAVLVGLMGEAQFDAFHLVNNELRLLGSVGYRNVYPDLIELLAQERLDLSRLITRCLALEHAVEQGFQALLQDKRQIKVLVNPTPALAEA